MNDLEQSKNLYRTNDKTAEQIDRFASLTDSQRGSRTQEIELIRSLILDSARDGSISLCNSLVANLDKLLKNEMKRQILIEHSLVTSGAIHRWGDQIVEHVETVLKKYVSDWEDALGEVADLIAETPLINLSDDVKRLDMPR